MTKFILHGGFTRRENELNRSFYEEVVRDVPEGGTVLLCYFASREADNSDKYQEDSQSLTTQAHGKKLTFLFATENDFIQQLKHADAVYIRGGSTSKLLRILRNYPDFKESLVGKTVAVSSAGAYVIASYGPSHAKGEVREGLHLLPLRVVCHYGSMELPPNLNAIELLKTTAPDMELVLLGDCEWKVFSSV